MWNPWDQTPRTLDPATLQWLQQNQQGGEFGGFRYQPQHSAYDGSMEGGNQPIGPVTQFNRIKLDEQGNPIGRDQEAFKPDGNYSHSWIESGGSWLDKNGWMVPLALMGVTNPGMFGLGGAPAAPGAASAAAGTPGAFDLSTGLFDMFGTDAIGAGFGAGGAGGVNLSALGGNALTAASSGGSGGGILKTIGDALGGTKGIGQIVGGIAGALDSKDKTVENKREPWGPAQDWIKSNIAQGQQMQQQLQAQPFNQAQQAGMSNIYGLLDMANRGAGGLFGGLQGVANNTFDRSNPRKTAPGIGLLSGFTPRSYGG
jgi:hypothetical protein